MWLLLKNLIYTVVIPGFIVGWMPLVFLIQFRQWPETSSLFGYLAFLPFSLGVTLYLSSMWQVLRKGQGTPLPLDPPQKVLTRGPYGWVRNPLYISFLLMVLGEALFFERVVLWLYLVFLASALQLIVVMVEEESMRRRFGALYSDYCNVTNRWRPRRPRPRTAPIEPFAMKRR
jgi:protein-S-isoprenylcysteine O-methyltransferase Ste14